ncbi:MAG: hypothetical protein V2A56_07020 [bacterium]
MKQVLLLMVLLGIAVPAVVAAQPAVQALDSLSITIPDSGGVVVDSTVSQPVSQGGDDVETTRQDEGFLRYLVPVLITVATGVATYLLFTVRSS